jgi:hypothetical protein
MYSDQIHCPLVAAFKVRKKLRVNEIIGWKPGTTGLVSL